MKVNKKKKILFIYYKLFKPSGVGKIIVNLANQLVSNGYDVDFLILSADLPHIYDIDKRINIHYIDSYAHWICKTEKIFIKYLNFIPKAENFYAYLFHIGVFLILKKWLNTNHHRYDSIISCWYKLSKLISFLPKVRSKTYAWEHTSYTVGGFFYNNILGNRYKYLKGIICINTPSIKYYQKYNITHFISNIIGEPFENKPFISSDKKENLISMICRLDYEKNVSEFLDIIKETNIPKNWQVHIIGDGSQAQMLKQKCVEKNIQNVKFLGYGNESQVCQLLKKSKIKCLTSTVEGLPSTLIEAMFHSNVLLAYDCNYGVSDIINENNGFLIPLHNKKLFEEKLEYLISNPDRYNELNQSAYFESQKWKKDKILEQWKKIL